VKARLGDLLVWLSGGDREILKAVPQERTKFTQQALVLLTTSSVASLSMFFALRDSLNAPLVAAFPLALFWGVTVLNLDRFLVVSLGYPRNPLQLVLLALPRLLLAIIVSSVIATPLVLTIFHQEISLQLQAEHGGSGILAQLQALRVIQAAR
jgi:Domain of unknown function (DUF4407)